MLQQGGKRNNLADELGYKHYNNFSTAFKKRFDILRQPGKAEQPSLLQPKYFLHIFKLLYRLLCANCCFLCPKILKQKNGPEKHKTVSFLQRKKRQTNGCCY